ncbi:hypothetical protein COOONC_08320 [Cooperia oncophora]
MKDKEQTSFCRPSETVGVDLADSTVSFATSFAEIRDAKVQEKIAFVQAIARRQDVIFGDGASCSIKAKEEAWKEVAREMEELGLKSFAARCESNHKPSGKLGDLDRLVLTIIGNFHSRLFAEFSIEHPSYDTSSDDLEVNNYSPEMKQENDYSMETNVLPSCFDAASRFQVPGRSSDQSSLTRSTDCSGTNDVHARSPKSEKGDSCSGPQRETYRESIAPSPVERNPRTRVHSSTQTLADVNDNADSAHHFSKRPRRTESNSVEDHNASDESNYLRRKQQLELKRMELENEKLEKEIQHLLNQEKRAKDLHSIELRRARLQLVMMGADMLQEPQRDE